MSNNGEETIPTKSTGESAAQKLAIEKKKLKVLKNALKDERAQREQVEKDLKTALDRVEQVK